MKKEDLTSPHVLLIWVFGIIFSSGLIRILEIKEFIPSGSIQVLHVVGLLGCFVWYWMAFSS